MKQQKKIPSKQINDMVANSVRGYEGYVSQLSQWNYWQRVIKLARRSK